MEKGGQIFNVFSEDDIKLISTNLHKLSDAKNTGEFFAYTNGFTKNDLIYPAMKKIVLDKLENVFNRLLHLVHGMLLKEKRPWTIHTDYIKGDNHPDMAILIPLNTEELNTHTVLFNEECTDNIDNFILNNAKLANNAADLYNNLCSHETIDRLEHLSLLGAYKWIPGSVIYWDRKLLHCSDNFLQNNIKEKIGLVLFTENI